MPPHPLADQASAPLVGTSCHRHTHAPASGPRRRYFTQSHFTELKNFTFTAEMIVALISFLTSIWLSVYMGFVAHSLCLIPRCAGAQGVKRGREAAAGGCRAGAAAWHVPGPNLDSVPISPRPKPLAPGQGRGSRPRVYAGQRFVTRLAKQRR